jgi:Siphovirus Gp157
MSDEPRGPSPFTIEQCVGAWQRARAQLAGDPDLADDEAAIANALGADPGAMHPDDLIRRIVRAIAFATMRTAEAKALAGTYRARQARYDKRLMVLRSELLDLMQILRYPRFMALEGTVSVARGVPSGVITDEEKIPMKYVKMIREINKRALNEDLKQGVVVEGAYLSNGAPSLRIVGITPIDEPDGEAPAATEEGSE